MPHRPAVFRQRLQRLTKGLVACCPRKGATVVIASRMTLMPTRILIVEDDPDIAELVARYLDKAGFITERAASGREALQTIAARPPGLMVLDLMLPHVDGLEVCRHVRASEATAAIPIIML